MGGGIIQRRCPSEGSPERVPERELRSERETERVPERELRSERVFGKV